MVNIYLWLSIGLYLSGLFIGKNIEVTKVTITLFIILILAGIHDIIINIIRRER